jgi:4-oxalomesaconate tautomerase
MVDKPIVTDRQNCGNILAGIGPFAVERGLVAAGHGSDTGEETRVRIRMVNTNGIVTATFPTQPPDQGGRPRYDGDTAIDGVPGTAAPVVLDFEASPAEDQGPEGGVFPTGNIADTFDGIQVTCVNNGMPVVLVAAASFGKTGLESIAELEADEELNKRVQALRLEAGKAMGLGDVSATTVPKISLVAPPAHGGTISTRTFIPVRVHESIGVLGAVSVGTAVLVPGAVGADLAVIEPGNPRLSIEHPSGALQVEVELDTTTTPPTVHRSGVVRTARKLFDGTVFPR